MTERPKRPRDPIQLAKPVIDIATGEVPNDSPKGAEQPGDAGAAESRYSRAHCAGAIKQAISGNPDMAHVSASHVERLNPSRRMSMRPLHAAYEWLLKEGREPRRSRRASLHVLQLRATA